MPKVELEFLSKKERDYFMAQLSDGWGENVCDLKWRGNFDTAEKFMVRAVCVRCEPAFFGDCNCEE